MLHTAEKLAKVLRTAFSGSAAEKESDSHDRSAQSAAGGARCEGQNTHTHTHTHTHPYKTHSNTLSLEPLLHQEAEERHSTWEYSRGESYHRRGTARKLLLPCPASEAELRESLTGPQCTCSLHTDYIEELLKSKWSSLSWKKEKEVDGLSPNGKASPFADCRPNGALAHSSDEDAMLLPLNHNSRDYVEASVCHVKDLENGQMREVDLGCGRALLIKQHGEFSAMAHKCPHYGAPLVKGVLSKGHVRCPWHGACFSTATGDIEDFPGLDSLPTFQVRVEKDKVIIRANKQALQSQKRSKPMSRCSAVINSNTGFSHVLIIGSGPASLVCAETLRQEGFTDRIVMCTMDRHPPYDRPKLSKSLESTAEQLRLRSMDFLQDHDIELLTEKEVVAVDVKTRSVTFEDGLRMEYRKLFIASGSNPKPMSYKGKDVGNVFHLRTPEDANSIARLANNKNAVIVGTSFVGMEVAAALTDKAHSVSVIGIEPVPFKKALGEKVGKAIMKLFETNRVKFYMLNEVSEMIGQHGQLKEVVLKSGKVLRADVCVIGAGSVPASGFLKQSGIHLDSKGFITVNKMMQTNVDGVFAGGDVVTFPFPPRNNKKVNIPHWQMAHVHGRVAALSMMGRLSEFKTVPYFWSAMFGKTIRYAGYGDGFDDVIIQGDLEELRFVAFYTRSEEVVAVTSMNYDPIVSRVAEVLGSGKTIKKARRGDWRHILAD